MSWMDFQLFYSISMVNENPLGEKKKQTLWLDALLEHGKELWMENFNWILFCASKNYSFEFDEIDDFKMRNDIDWMHTMCSVLIQNHVPLNHSECKDIIENAFTINKHAIFRSHQNHWLLSHLRFARLFLTGIKNQTNQIGSNWLNYYWKITAFKLNIIFVDSNWISMLSFAFHEISDEMLATKFVYVISYVRRFAIERQRMNGELIERQTKVEHHIHREWAKECFY